MSTFITEIWNQKKTNISKVEVEYTTYTHKDDVALYGAVEIENVYLIFPDGNNVEININDDQSDEIYEKLEEHLQIQI